MAFLDNFPYTLVKHENEIDSLGLKDGTADTNKCCQLPWQVSADNGSGQPNGTVAMSFLSNFLANICSPLLCVLCVGHDNIGNVILWKKEKKKKKKKTGWESIFTMNMTFKSFTNYREGERHFLKSADIITTQKTEVRRKTRRKKLRGREREQ